MLAFEGLVSMLLHVEQFIKPAKAKIKNETNKKIIHLFVLMLFPRKEKVCQYK